MKWLVATLPALPGAAWADSPGSYGYAGHPMMWDGGYGAGFMGVGMMVIFWAVLIGLGYVAVRWLMERGEAGRKPDALAILKERLARGEIEPEDYEARRKLLEG